PFEGAARVVLCERLTEEACRMRQPVHGMRTGFWVRVRNVAVAGCVLLTQVGRPFVMPAAADGCPRNGSIERVSVAANGDQGNDRSLLATTDDEGCVVAFKSSASNLIPDDTNGKVDVFVRDRRQGTIERVSVSDLPGRQSNDNSFPPALNGADG